ncbi:MAG: thioredoxin fold domain-containing protein [Ferruginibacter sp.]
MKKHFLFILLTTICIAAIAQDDSTLLYRRFPIIPSFKLINVADSSIFTKDNLKKKKATIIMMFSPDCEHCQAETKELTAKIGLFKKAQIIMASPLDFNYLREFYKEYKIADYPTITMGRDPIYFFGTFFKVRSFPSIFVYDKKGNLVNSFTGSTPVEQIAASL